MTKRLLLTFFALVLCAGTALAGLRMWAPFVGAPATAGDADRPGNNQCLCFLAALVTSTGIASLDTLEVNASASDANDTVKAGIYTEDGQKRVFSCTVDVTSTGARTCANGDTSGTVLEGNYWFCFSEALTATQDWQIRRASGTANASRVATETITCTGGTLPTTWTPSARSVGAAVNPPFLWVTDD